MKTNLAQPKINSQNAYFAIKTTTSTMSILAWTPQPCYVMIEKAVISCQNSPFSTQKSNRKESSINPATDFIKLGTHNVRLLD